MAVENFNIVKDPQNPDKPKLLNALDKAHAPDEKRVRIKLRTTNPLHPYLEMQVTGLNYTTGSGVDFKITGLARLNQEEKPKPATALYNSITMVGTVRIGEEY